MEKLARPGIHLGSNCVFYLALAFWNEIFEKGFLILHPFQSSGVDQVFVWAMVGTFNSIEGGELMSHKFSHSAPCVGFFFLVALVGPSSPLTSQTGCSQQGPGQALGDQEPGRGGSINSSYWEAVVFFRLSEILSFCPAVDKLCKGNIYWIPHSPGATSHGRSLKLWEAFWLLLNCTDILNPMSSPQGLGPALCKLIGSSKLALSRSLSEFSFSLLENFLPSLHSSVQHAYASSPICSYALPLPRDTLPENSSCKLKSMKFKFAKHFCNLDPA